MKVIFLGRYLDIESWRERLGVGRVEGPLCLCMMKRQNLLAEVTTD